MKESMRYAGAREGQWLRGAKGDRPHQPFFGFTLVSCEKGDIRQSPNGLTIYGDSGKEEIPLPPDYVLEWGGEYEDSSKAQAALAASLPAAGGWHRNR